MDSKILNVICEYSFNRISCLGLLMYFNEDYTKYSHLWEPLKESSKEDLLLIRNLETHESDLRLYKNLILANITMKPERTSNINGNRKFNKQSILKPIQSTKKIYLPDSTSILDIRSKRFTNIEINGTNLIDAKIRNCDGYIKFPPSVRHINLEHCKNVDKCIFPENLKSIRLYFCKYESDIKFPINIKSISIKASDDVTIVKEKYPNLKYLDVRFKNYNSIKSISDNVKTLILYDVREPLSIESYPKKLKYLKLKYIFSDISLNLMLPNTLVTLQIEQYTSTITCPGNVFSNLRILQLLRHTGKLNIDDFPKLEIIEIGLPYNYLQELLNNGFVIKKTIQRGLFKKSTLVLYKN